MQAIISFFAQFDSVVTTKVFIDNGQECFALISKHDQKYNTPYKFYRGDLASSAINFIYDDCTMGRVLHTFQDSSSTQKLEMDSKNVLHWKPLWQLAEWLYQSTNLHPYYYSLLSAIINLYNQGMRNEAPTPFESSALVHTAEALLHLYETVRQFLDTCTRTDNCEQAWKMHVCGTRKFEALVANLSPPKQITTNILCQRLFSIPKRPSTFGITSFLDIMMLE